jgi:hypothetical protein
MPRKKKTSSKSPPVNPPHFVFEGTLASGGPLTIYGEVHNDIPDNRFYERLDLNDKVVMVEHATVLCDIDPKDEALLARQDFRGSEYIWYSRTKQGLPVVCVDTRIENNFLSAINERVLSQHGPSNVNMVLQAYNVTMDALKNSNTDLHLKYVNPYIKDVLRATMLQADILEKLTVAMLEVEDVDELHVVTQTATITSVHLIKNVIKLASMTVDAHIMHLLESHKGPKGVVVFTGLAHAYRLAHLLNNHATLLSVKGQAVPRSSQSDLEPSQNERFEKTLLAKLTVPQKKTLKGRSGHKK